MGEKINKNITTFANREIIISFATQIAFLAIEIRLTLASAVVITTDSDSTDIITTAG